MGIYFTAGVCFCAAMMCGVSGMGVYLNVLFVGCVYACVLCCAFCVFVCMWFVLLYSVWYVVWV